LAAISLVGRTAEGGWCVRVAALYDIHGNLPALDAVLDEVRAASVDRIVVGGDVLPGPMPCETLERLFDLGAPVEFIHGNGELAVLAQVGVTDPAHVTYWGITLRPGQTSSPTPPAAVQEVLRWTAAQVHPRYDEVLRSWPPTCRLDIPGVGAVLFCHGTPRSETEGFTRLTPEDRLAPVFTGLGVDVVVCGHTHMQFDRTIAGVRVVNAGSVGMPFGQPGADWLLLGPDVQLRHTAYDLQAAARRVRGTPYPQADEFAEKYILAPPSEAAMVELFTSMSFP
jgi:predicted phosphodiesterase